MISCLNSNLLIIVLPKIRKRNNDSEANILKKKLYLMRWITSKDRLL